MTEHRQIDLLAHETHSGPDAFETYRYLREEAPVYYDEANALWAVSRYEDVCHVARHPELFTSTEGNLPHMPADASMINQDGRQHTLQRGLVSKGFTPRRMRELADHIRLVTNELIDDLGTRTECEAVSELAARLPLRVIGEMLGLPHADHEHILHLTDIMVAGGAEAAICRLGVGCFVAARAMSTGPTVISAAGCRGTNSKSTRNRCWRN